MSAAPPANGGGGQSPREEARREKAGEDVRPPTAGDEADSPGVPGFHTWRGVYWFVFGCFAAVVAGLTIFSWVYA